MWLPTRCAVARWGGRGQDEDRRRSATSCPVLGQHGNSFRLAIVQRCRGSLSVLALRGTDRMGVSGYCTSVGSLANLTHPTPDAAMMSAPLPVRPPAAWARLPPPPWWIEKTGRC